MSRKLKDLTLSLQVHATNAALKKEAKQELLTLSQRVDNKEFDTKLPYSHERGSAEHKAYHDDQNHLTDLFRAACEKECETSHLPEDVRDAIYFKADRDGHSSGFSGVLCEYQDLAEYTLRILTLCDKK